MKYIFQITQLCILLFLSLYSFAQISNAKRAVPKEVTPVLFGLVKYTAPTNSMGYIVATDVLTNKTIWSKKIYQVIEDMELERDVQDIFIDSIYLKKDKLYIHNEARRVYTIDLKTLEIKIYSDYCNFYKHKSAFLFHE